MHIYIYIYVCVCVCVCVCVYGYLAVTAGGPRRVGLIDMEAHRSFSRTPQPAPWGLGFGDLGFGVWGLGFGG